MSRIDIIAEVVRRLGTLDPPVQRGFAGLEVSRFPSIWVFEDQEETLDGANSVITTSRHRGKLNKKLPIIVEYFDRIRSTEDAYERGNEILGILAVALELDPYFANLSGQNLVTGYYMRSNVILPIREGVVEVVAMYDFLYKADHYGLQ